MLMKSRTAFAGRLARVGSFQPTVIRRPGSAARIAATCGVSQAATVALSALRKGCHGCASGERMNSTIVADRLRALLHSLAAARKAVQIA